jgi:hypothetical protein
LVESGQDEESPAQRGGAEGTRTPDPHTASVIFAVSRSLIGPDEIGLLAA